MKIKYVNKMIGHTKDSEDELVKQLTESIYRSNNGNTKSAREVSKAMRIKYGI